MARENYYKRASQQSAWLREAGEILRRKRVQQSEHHSLKEVIIPGDRRFHHISKEEGIKEEKIRMAKSLLASGMSAEQICQITGLSKDELS